MNFELLRCGEEKLICIVIDRVSIDFAAYVKSECEEAPSLFMILFSFNINE